MALEGSHIRFALDLKEKFGITDIGEYVLGSIYPDSRYVTKIDRYVTHPIHEYKTDPFFKKDDFTKGWYTHLFCDDIQYSLTKEIFPEVLEKNFSEDDKYGGKEEWLKRTAIKILQDMQDVRLYDIKKYLDYLNEIKLPNGEDESKAKIFNQSLQDLYKNPESITIDSYGVMWEKWGVDDELGKRLIEQTKLFSENESIMRRVNGFYNMILERALSNLS